MSLEMGSFFFFRATVVEQFSFSHSLFVLQLLLHFKIQRTFMEGRRVMH